MARGSVGDPGFRLDHVSIGVPHLGDAADRFARQFGLEVTVSPAAPEHHGRIYLDRSYLEVAVRPDVTTWDVTGFFLGFTELAVLEAHLDGADLAYRYDVYQGVDGRWDDVWLDVDDVPVPGLVRRTEPPEAARNWPPSLARAQRCGASTLAAFHVPVPDLEVASRFYERLVGSPASHVPTRQGSDQRRVVLPLSVGTIVLIEGGERPAAVLGVASLAESSKVLGPRLLSPDDDDVAWLDPSVTTLALGFAETRPAGSRAP
jgi:catechol 2,3-dioxygenase-like lactoylglutathione lyase family enzyme